MILLTDRPAGLILAGNLAVLFFGMGYLLVNVLEILPVGDRSAGILAATTGGGVLVSDLIYRKVKGLSLLDVSKSTVYGVIPTWLTSVVLFGITIWFLSRG